MEKVRITRTGQLDLEFEGQEIATGSEYRSNGERQNRYNEWTLYGMGESVKSCNYLLHEQYITRYQGEESTSRVYVFDTLESVRDHFITDETDYISDDVKVFLQDAGINMVETLP